MSKFFINIVLFVVAVILLLTLGTIGLIYTFFSSFVHFKNKSFLKYWGNLLYQINVGIDQIGNVLLGEFLNRFAVKKLIHPFGKVNETISYAIAKNTKELSKLGRFIYDIIDWIDRGHFDKALLREGNRESVDGRQ